VHWRARSVYFSLIDCNFSAIRSWWWPHSRSQHTEMCDVICDCMTQIYCRSRYYVCLLSARPQYNRQNISSHITISLVMFQLLKSVITVRALRLEGMSSDCKKSSGACGGDFYIKVMSGLKLWLLSFFCFVQCSCTTTPLHPFQKESKAIL
jgi:hypothetical protein